MQTAPDLQTHFRQLAAAVSSDGSRDERNRRFLQAFVRPAGLDAPATPAFVAALEQLSRDGARPDPSLAYGAWLRPAVTAAAGWSRVGLGRWLMNDERADASDEHEAMTDRSVLARQRARERRQLAKVRRKTWRQRRDRAMYAGKVVKSALRRARHRTAITVYRALYVMRLYRGELPGSSGHD